MANNNNQPFESIRIEGGLVSVKVLQDLRQYSLEGQASADYGIEKGLKFNDEIARYWRIAHTRWQEYRKQCERKDIDQTAMTVTEWLWPLFEKILDYRLTAIEPILLGEREFPMTHTAFDGTVPFVLCDAGYPLDKSHEAFGQEGSKRSPTGLAQEYLNAETKCLWAIVCNGQFLRIVRDNPAMTRPAFIEVDLGRLFDEDNYTDFATLWLLLHSSRLASQDDRVDLCWLEQWREKGQSDGERVLGSLRYGVAEALRQLGTGFVQHPENKALREQLTRGELTVEAYFQQVLTLVYRLLFLLTAEDRDVALYPKDTEDEARQLGRARYLEGYSVSLLREKARLLRHYDKYSDSWQMLCINFKGFAEGQVLLAQPALGGLFAADQCQDLEAGQLANRFLLKAVAKLAYFKNKNILQRINYRDMDTEEFGSVYESLLELVPQISQTAEQGGWAFSFMGDDPEEAKAGGHSRKLTGSYYTPDSLVQELIKSALEPVLEERLAANPADPKSALLSINVCDPACGSGHFLLAAARRLAKTLADLNAGTGQTTGDDYDDYRKALREVVRHCIFGVDLNPMAVELCKTGLWLESIEPGKPLSFLDAHIQQGNSLLGVYDDELTENGIPSKAFSVKTGDDSEICKELNKQNKHFEKRLQISSRQTKFHLVDEIESLPEDSLCDLKIKRKKWLEYRASSDYKQTRLLEDMYMAAFFSEKSEENKNLVPTNAHLDLYLMDEKIPDEVLLYTSEVAETFNVFHWKHAFPQVFTEGGFDLVIGNPPWDVVKREEGDKLTEAESERIKKWFGFGMFEKAKGKKDLYKLFLALSTKLISNKGKVALVIPVGVFIEEKPMPLRKYLLNTGSVESLNIFQNTGKRYFSSVHASYIFSLLVYSPRKLNDFSYSTIREHGGSNEPEFFTGSYKEILNSDLTITLLSSPEATAVYQKILKQLNSYDLLDYRVTAEFHASSDKPVIKEMKENNNDWVVLKNDGIHQFNPFYGEPIGYISDVNVKDKVESKGFFTSLYGDEEKKRLVFRDIARSDDSRTLIACLLPYGYVSTYDIPIVLPKEDYSEDEMGFYLGFFNSIVFDYLVRPHIDKHVKGYILQRLKIPIYDSNNKNMLQVSSLALSLNEVGDSSYGSGRARIDALVVKLIGLNATEFKVITESFVRLKKSSIFKENYANYFDEVLAILAQL